MLFPCSLVVRAGRSWIGLLPGCVLMLCSGRPRPGRPGTVPSSAARPAPLPRRPAATACRRPGLLHPLGRMLCSGRTGPARPAAPSPGLTAIRPGLPQAPPYAAPGCGSADGSGCCWGAPGCCAQAGPARLRCSPRCPAAQTPPPPVRSWSLQAHPFQCRRVGAGHRCFWPFHSSCYCPESVPRLRRPRICFPMTLGNFYFYSQQQQRICCCMLRLRLESPPQDDRSRRLAPRQLISRSKRPQPAGRPTIKERQLST
jgi:hypothetical protein